MVRTTVKQHAFAFLVFDIRHWVIPLCLRRRYFEHSNHVPGIPPDGDRLAEKLALLHLRLFPRPFSNHATECSRAVGDWNQHMSLQKCANLSDCGRISACVTDTRIPARVSIMWYYRCLAARRILSEIEAVLSGWNILWCSDRTLLSIMRSVYDVLPLRLPAVCWHVW